MRVLMTTTGHAGHVLSLLPFANALMRALPGLSVEEANERVIGDALPPVDAAVDLLRAISAHARTMPLQRR